LSFYTFCFKFFPSLRLLCLNSIHLLAFNNKAARCLPSLLPPPPLSLSLFPIPCSNVPVCLDVLLSIVFPKACQLETS
jgi:hypothetical protein